MAINKLNSNLNIISNLPDKPTQEVSALKAKFDEAGNTIKDYDRKSTRLNSSH